MNSREVSFIVVFSALWAALQVQFGPIIGRFSVGPISFHGSVNRVVGWLLMTVLAGITQGFGKVTAMTVIAVFGTRVIRANPFEGFIVGLGYVVGGFAFDLLINAKFMKKEAALKSYLLTSAISGLLASAPYLLIKIYFLGLRGFMLASLTYIFSTFKALAFTLLGASLGIRINYRLKRFMDGEPPRFT